MTILPERFVRFAIRDLKEDIKKLWWCNNEGIELERAAEYRAWLIDLEAYYAENCTPPTDLEEQEAQEKMIRKILEDERRCDEAWAEAIRDSVR